MLTEWCVGGQQPPSGAAEGGSGQKAFRRHVEGYLISLALSTEGDLFLLELLIAFFLRFCFVDLFRMGVKTLRDHLNIPTNKLLAISVCRTRRCGFSGTQRHEIPMLVAEISSTADRNDVVSSSQWYDLRHL